MVNTVDDEWWMIYHAWRFGKINTDPPGRQVLVDKILWTDDGWPYVGSPSQTPQPAPFESAPFETLEAANSGPGLNSAK